MSFFKYCVRRVGVVDVDVVGDTKRRYLNDVRRTMAVRKLRKRRLVCTVAWAPVCTPAWAPACTPVWERSGISGAAAWCIAGGEPWCKPEKWMQNCV